MLQKTPKIRGTRVDDHEKGNNQNGVVTSVAKRFDTTIFGTLATIELHYPEIVKEKSKWDLVRMEILDKVNKEKKMAIKLLKYGCDIDVKPTTIVWKRQNPDDGFLRLVEVNGEKIEETL